ncbi:MAG TPA: CHASE domain-containing protein [Ramlibacter sp.]|uniref:CHASE domain-containing protein n=1 Tax=Ramlibacter sp. TaxID=1917967 RepID=UPI002D7E156B|nr:CHASE domain-containing protein [Ramlibacter sp.]HET8746467.1 CHASE domain-containing protein [Ramlibacter sp.]
MFLVALLATTLLLFSVDRTIAARDREAFEAEVARTTDSIQERLDTTLTLLHGVAGLFMASVEVERDEFTRYAAQLQLRRLYPGILGIGFSERIPAPELAQREAQLRASGVPGFHVWPAQPRDEYHAIVFIEPLEVRNRQALGYDMFTEPVRQEAMARARDEGRPAASGRVTLVQEIERRKQAGVLVYLPVYRGGAVPPTVEARRAALLGFAYAPLRMDDLLHGVRGAEARRVDYELFDGPRALPEALMRSTRDGGSHVPAFSASRMLEVAGRIWRLEFTSTSVFEAQSQRRLVPWLAAVSLGASLLLGGIAFLQARGRREAERAAAQRRRNELALQASEERARERAERLEQVSGQLRDADRRKDEFLAMLAHELRNPLAPLRNSLEILRRLPDGPAAQRAREIAERQVRHMVRLIDDLLDVSRISRGKITLHPERASIAAVVEAAVETSRPLIDARGHSLRVRPLDRSLELVVDPARVAQILTNLLNNAATYTPPGGRIEVGMEADEREVRIAVRDNGIGIAPEKMREVFQLFVQAERSPAGGGLGIGLSLAASLADLHGGHIEGRSDGPGQGAEFVLVLPRDGAGGEASSAPAHPADAAL